MKNDLIIIYQRLLKHFGDQRWWPATRRFESKEWEICLGAILTQNTNWRNVEKALDNLEMAGKWNAKSIVEASREEIEKLIRPSGFYKQKAERLILFSTYILKFDSLETFLKNVKRDELLQLKGIGPETADSILLYAGNRPYFVVDAYTRRIFSRMKIIKEGLSYETIRNFFEQNLPRNISIYQQFHALIVLLAKKFCRKQPLCEDCPLKNLCSYAKK